jgi:branched-chain amino acid transport system substrate-binding protein
MRSVLVVFFLIQGCSMQSGPIRIGLLGPVSNNDGIPMHNAAQLAVEEINRDGGIHGRPIEIVERDDHGSADSALTAATELQRAGVVAVIGSVYSSITLAVAPIFNEGRDPVVQISPSSSTPSISEAGPYTFRLCPSDLAHGAALARYARESLHYERGAVLYQNDDYGRGIRRAFLDEFTRRGGTVVEVDPYLPGTEIPRVYLERMAKRGHPQFVFVAGLANEGGPALEHARELGLKSPFMGGDGLSDLAEVGPSTEGTYISVAYSEDLVTPRNRAFTQAYRAKFPSSPPLNQSGAGTYEALYLLRDAIARAGTDRRRIRDAIAAVGTSIPAAQGLTGTIAFDENGDVPSRQVIVGVVRGGSLRPTQLQ